MTKTGGKSLLVIINLEVFGLQILERIKAQGCTDRFVDFADLINKDKN